jgi:GT2 family glycosyltransferase
MKTIEEKTEGISYEVIVVDNNPTEQFAIDLKDYLDKIIYLPLKENVGFGRANNEGLKVAKGRNIFFLNPDTLLINNAIKILSDYLDANENVGVCGGNLYDASMNPTHSFIPMLPSPIWDLNNLLANIIFKLFYGKNIQYNFTEKPLKEGYVTGADMMVRRSVLDEVGSFDSDFFMYYEETELSYRIKKAKFDIISLPEAKIIHLEGKSISTNSRREGLKSTSKKLYYQKTQSMFAYYCSNILAYANAVLRIIYAKFRRDKEQQEYWSIIKDNL